MKSLILSEYVEEMQEQIVMDLFSVPHKLARDAIHKAGNELKDIKHYINKRSRPNVYGKCRYCGRKLTDPISIQRGYGLECYNKYGVKKKYIDLLEE